MTSSLLRFSFGPLCSAGFFFLILFSCSKKDTPGSTTQVLTTQVEINAARSEYQAAGLEFVNRIYYRPDDRLNSHSIEVRYLRQIGSTTFYFSEASFAATTTKYGTLTGEFTDAEKGPILANGPTYRSMELDFDAIGTLWRSEYATYSGDPVFNYFGGAAPLIRNLTTNKTAATAMASVQGYARKAGSEIMVPSLSQNDFGGKPACYFNQGDTLWRREPLSFVPSVPTDYPLSFDSESFGGDKLFLAWTSSAGKVYCARFQGGSWSAPGSQPCTPVIHTAGIGGYFRIYLFPNPADADKPYVVVHKRDKLDIFKWNGSGLSVVKSNMTVPQGLTYPAGGNFAARDYTCDMAFTGGHIYLLIKENPNAENLGKLFVLDEGNQTFEAAFPETSTLATERVRELEGTADGVLLVYYRFLTKDGVTREVSDVVKKMD
jgi:hypothetical protein